MNTETLVMFGESVKALDDGKVGGYLVRFSTERDTDISSMKDFFTSETDFDIDDWENAKATVYYNHGLDEALGKRKLAKASLKMDEVGVWVEAQLEMRDEYERRIYEMAKAGKLGWSSGTAAHLIERQKVGNAHKVLTWPLGPDASLTPTPAEPRNAVVSLKSLVDAGDAEASSENDLQANPQAGLTLEQHSETVLAAVKDYTNRLKSLKELRAKDGRNLSENARTQIENTSNELKSLLDELTDIASVPAEYIEDDVANALYAEFLANTL